MAAELQHHLDLETEARIARGTDPRDARITAQRRFGSVAHVEDDCRDSWGMRAIDVLSQDVRCGVRSLRKCVAALACLAPASRAAAIDPMRALRAD